MVNVTFCSLTSAALPNQMSADDKGPPETPVPFHMSIPFASQLPYTLHTNRELGLMLAGKKPLAVFVDGYGTFPHVVCRYLRLFDRHVATGRFVRRDQILPPGPHHDCTIHRIYFALPNEDWRIDAMIALKASAKWSRDHERREGQLLGYEDWMNDHFLDRFYPTAL